MQTSPNDLVTLVNLGTPAPAFTLPDQSGMMRTLAEFSGAPLVLYFYPKDDTSACTEEACAFGEMLPKFAGAAVLGVSPDSVKSHAKFALKYSLDFPLLADVAPDGGVPQVCTAFGVWQEKSMYGKKYMGVVRTTYLIAADGKVARRWDKVKVAGHAEEVLSAVRELVGGAALAPSKRKPAANKSGRAKAFAAKAAPKKPTQKKSTSKEPVAKKKTAR